jgi:hypothetical protein
MHNFQEKKEKRWKNDLAYLRLVLDEGGVVVTVKIVACPWWCGFLFEFSFFFFFLSFFISSFPSSISWFRTPPFSTQISFLFWVYGFFLFFLPLIFSSFFSSCIF